MKNSELVTPHFKFSELACPCCDKMNMPTQMLDFLERLRNTLGKPVVINSGVRCPMHNAKKGGKSTSAHLQGLAVDVACHATVVRRQLIEAALKAGVKNIGIYKTHLHLDIMDKPQGPNIYVKGEFNFS